MTIQELVGKHGMSVHIRAKKLGYPSFVVRSVVPGGWLVDYPDKTDHFVAMSDLNGYEIVPPTDT